MKLNINTFLITLLIGHILSAQSYQFRGNDLFGTQYNNADSTQRAIKLMFNDVDFDGDQDMIVAGIEELNYDSTGNISSFDQIKYFLLIQENTGTRWAPNFGQRKPFIHSFPFPNGYFFPAIGDVNGDRKLDLFVAAETDTFLNLIPLVYERKSVSGNDQFNIIKCTDLNLPSIVAGSFFVPELADFDQDGDLDILLSGFLPSFDDPDEEQTPIFFFAKNTGTKTDPKFVGWYHNPYGLIKTIDQIQIATVGDIDNDNDNDIISLTNFDTFTVINYFENTPLPNGKANFTSFGSLSGLPVGNTEETIFFPALVDIDGDGDLDIFIPQELISDGTGIGYYENLLCDKVLDNTVTRINDTLIANLIGVKYQWIDCSTFSEIPGETNQRFSPSESGAYAVKVFDTEKCENTSACIEVILTGTEDMYDQTVTLSPNPAVDFFSIINHSHETIERLEITNQTGETIKSLAYVKDMNIHVSDLPGGVYFCKIVYASGAISKPLIIVSR